MAGNRGYGQPWELHLSALHVVVWSGLAVGAMVGAYFVGFFTGRVVGFETARSASGVEVPKLALTEEMPDRPSQNVSAIYDKLNAPALLEESAVVPAKGRTETEPPVGVQAAQAIKAGEAQRSPDAQNTHRQESPIASSERVALNQPSKKDVREPMAKDGSHSAAEIDSLFDSSREDDASEEPTGGEIAATSAQNGVRMLGGDVKEDGAANSDRTLGMILEERLAKARAEAEKGERVEKAVIEVKGAEPSSKSGGKQENTKQDAVKESSRTNASTTGRSDTRPGQDRELVKSETSKAEPKADKTDSRADSARTDQVNPGRQAPGSGYFAQVAAPKRMADAEEIARKLRKSGFPVSIETANVRGEAFYRVLVGPEENKVQADRLVEQLQRERYLSGAPFIRKLNK